MDPALEPERDTELPAEVVWDRIAWLSDDLGYEDFDAVRADRERFLPLMLKSLRDVAAEPERYAGEELHHGHECALAFFAEFRAAEAFPAILQFLEAIEGFEDAVLPGDIITEDLPSLIASTFDGNLDSMKVLIEDERLDEFVRASTLAAIGILVRCEKVERTELSAYLGSLIRSLPREPSMAWEEVATQILYFRFVEHREQLQELIKSGDIIEARTSDDIRSAFDEDSYPTDDLRYELVDDAEELIGVWREFYWEPDLVDEDEDADEDEAGGWDDGPDPAPDDGERIPFVRETPKVGRNEPCPCGSGKKFKRCCEGK